MAGLRQVLRLVLAGGALLAAGLVPDVAGEDAPRLAGRWRVGYHDADLGWIEGSARVAADEASAEVTLRHPATGQTTRLATSSVQRTPEGARLQLQGPSPCATTAPWVGPARALDLAPGREDLHLRLGATELRARLTPPSPAPPDRVDLDLAFTASGDLVGTWTQRLRADTARDDAGGGRRGSVSLSQDGSGLAHVVGVERWWRPSPRIYHVVVVQDQASQALDGPAWPYPVDERGRETGTALIDRTRTLLVVGDDLPTERADPVDLRSLGGTMEYEVRAVRQDMEESNHYAWEVERGWEKLERALPPEAYAAARRTGSMLLRARAGPGGLPGWQGFTLDGAEATWLLEFGDFTGELRVARPLDAAGNTELTRHVFDPERVVFELEADRELPFDQIPLLLARNGAFLAFEGRREVPAHRVTDRPRLYRTEPFLVSGATPQDEPRAIRAVAGDRISAALAVPGWVRARPGEARATVSATPRAVASALGVAQESLDWPSALGQAARCANLPPQDAARLTREDALRRPAFVVFTTGERFREIDVLVGDHAAMLMLRQVFIERMREMERDLTVVLRDARLLEGFHRSLEPHARVAAHHPITQLRVPTPDGREDTFQAAFVPTYLEQRYGLRGAERDAWVREATRKALSQYVVALGRAREQAEAIKPCDVEALMELTGVGFDALRREAEQRLVRRAEGSPTWEADPTGRPWLHGVAPLAAAIRAQDARQALDRAPLLLALSALTSIGSAAWGGGWALLELAAGAADLGWTTFDAVASQYAEQRELRLAMGASVLIGGARHEEALARDRSWAWSAFALAGSALPLLRSDLGVIAGPGVRAAVDRTERLLAATPDLPRLPIEEGPRAAARARLVQWVEQLAESERVDLARAVLRARAVERGAGKDALTAGEARCSEVGHALEETWELPRASRPGWAERLDDVLFQRIRPLLGEGTERRDIPRLFLEDPVQVGRLVREDDGLALLGGDGFLRVSELSAALEQARRRIRVGSPEHFHSAAAQAPTPPGLRVYGDENLVPREGGGQELTLNVYLGARRAPIAEVKVGRGPSPLGAGQEMLVLDTAVVFRRAAQVGEGVTAATALGALVPPGSSSEPIPTFVRTGVDMVPGRGTPLVLYLALRGLNDLGIGFADPAIRVVKLQTILNVETTVQLGWLRAVYPSADPGDLFRHTDIYRYAESVVEQAGWRVEGVEMRFHGFASRPAQKADPRNPFFTGREPPERFLERYPLPPEVEGVAIAFDAYLHVRPR